MRDRWSSTRLQQMIIYVDGTAGSSLDPRGDEYRLQDHTAELQAFLTETHRICMRNTQSGNARTQRISSDQAEYCLDAHRSNPAPLRCGSQ